MVHYIQGSIFGSKAQTLVNPVNTVGVMGKGLAAQFKQRYPEMFTMYKRACDNRLLETGKLMLYRNLEDPESDKWILLFPTKENWRNPSKLEYIEAGLQRFVKIYEMKKIKSVAFPKLGCGAGKLNWEDVCPLMEKYLNPLPIPVYIYF